MCQESQQESKLILPNNLQLVVYEIVHSQLGIIYQSPEVQVVMVCCGSHIVPPSSMITQRRNAVGKPSMNLEFLS